MTDPYQFWRDSLAGKAPPITNEDPMAGFYRMKDQRSGKFVPVAVFPDAEGTLRFKINGVIVPAQKATESWPWFAANPVTEEEYRKVAEKGANWSDMDETVAEIAQAPQSSELADLQHQIDTAVGGADAYETIDSDEQSKKAQTLRALLLKLSKQADDLRKGEKEPHLKASRDVDARWQPIVKEAADAATAIRKAMENWENLKLAAQAEAMRKAAEGQPVVRPNVPPPAAQVKGAYGKAASAGTFEEVEITDIDAVFVAFKAHPEVFELLTKLAQKAVDNGASVPGTKTTTKSRIR